MAVKHIPTGVVHIGNKGENTNEHPSHWVNTNERVNCKKNGCR